MFKHLIFIFSLVAVLSLTSFAQDKPETEKKSGCCSSMMKSEVKAETSDDQTENVVWNKVCPVEGDKVESGSPAFEYNGKLIGFCCEGCDSKFKKNPETYLKNLNEDGSRFIRKS
jgi:YHS domain-containing protein